jgi:SAM-dependent methyltransferase
MRIRYDIVDNFEGWRLAAGAISRIALDAGSKNILEIGAGANPTLPVSFLQEHGIDYTTNDISPEELLKAAPEYRRLCLDLCDETPGEELSGKFDLVFSRMVNEHVRDGEAYYRNILRILQPGGLTVHWFSTLYAFPFLVNRLVPEWLSDRLLNIFSPRDRFQHDKFKAYYSWGRGPTKQMLNRFSAMGFEVIEYVGYFGHSYYRKRLGILHGLEMRKANWLKRHPVPQLTSYACVILKKR